MRATLRLSSPAWLAAPKYTSSIAPGSTPARATASLITSAARSSGRSPASAPPYRPTGVRTAEMTTALATRMSLESRGHVTREPLDRREAVVAEVDAVLVHVQRAVRVADFAH